MNSRQIFTDTFFSNALPVLEEIIFSTMEQHPDIIPMLANVREGSGWGAQTTEQTGVGAVTQIAEGGSVNYDTVAQGNSKTFQWVKYGIGVQITKEMIKDQKLDQVGDIYRSLGNAMHHTRQTLFMNNFNNGFLTNGYDGVPLFSTSHPLVKAGGTQKNTPSAQADLSVTSLQQALTDIRGTLSHEGFKIMLRPKTVLVNTANTYNAHELLRSDLKPGTANNDANYFTISGLDYMASEYLTDADAWFVLCDKTQHRLMWYDREAPMVSSYEDFDSDSLKTKITSRWDTGHASWFGLYGSSGA